jgi:hypothetical protein
LALDVKGEWPGEIYDAIFSANSVHIMSWPEVEQLFEGIGRYTSDSNRRFDAWLKARDPLSGIRGYENLNRLAEAQGISIKEDIEMPANNRILVWQR